MNSIIVNGRIGREPELTVTANAGLPIVKFSLADDQYDYQKNEKVAQWFNIVFFGKSAERAEKVLKKGMKVSIFGELRIRPYTDREGTKRQSIEVIANNFDIHIWPKDGDPMMSDTTMSNEEWAEALATSQGGGK